MGTFKLGEKVSGKGGGTDITEPSNLIPFTVCLIPYAHIHAKFNTFLSLYKIR